MTDLCCACCAKLYFPFLHVIAIIFQAIQNHHGGRCASKGNNPLFIGFNMSGKFSYQADNDNIKNGYIINHQRSSNGSQYSSGYIMPSFCITI